MPPPATPAARPPPAAPARLGLLGGTFDPPHRGHLAAAVACRDALHLDRVLLVVANDPWQKSARQVSPAGDRLAMVEAAIEGIPGLGVSDMEIERGGPSYTVDTVEALRAAADRAEPAPDVYLIVGADLVATLSSWRRPEALAELVTLVVVARPHAVRQAPPPGWRVLWVEGDAVDVSSSALRDRLERGLPVDGLVPDAVIRCIERRGLYAVGR